MYRCYLTNFGWFLEGQFQSIHQAISFGKSKGHEFTVYHNNTIVGYCSGVSLSWHMCNSEYHDKMQLTQYLVHCILPIKIKQRRL
jgi:hypothetical protein